MLPRRCTYCDQRAPCRTGGDSAAAAEAGPGAGEGGEAPSASGSRFEGLFVDPAITAAACEALNNAYEAVRACAHPATGALRTAAPQSQSALSTDHCRQQLQGLMFACICQ